MPFSPNARAVAGASATLTLKLMPKPFWSLIAGGVSRYDRHGWIQCDRVPHGTSVRFAELIGCSTVVQVSACTGDVRVSAAKVVAISSRSEPMPPKLGNNGVSPE